VPSCCPKREAGFSLVEVLLAIAIAGLIVAATAGVFRNGLLGHAAADDAATAAALADQKLAEAGITETLRPGSSAGVFGRFRWRVTVAPFVDKESAGEESADQDAAPAFRLYRVAAQIEWNDGPRRRQYELATVRLGPAPP
jgi:prepilin-type N-terminal cleavage/methylation domain-containing protein